MKQVFSNPRTPLMSDHVPSKNCFGRNASLLNCTTLPDMMWYFSSTTQYGAFVSFEIEILHYATWLELNADTSSDDISKYTRFSM